VASKKQGTSASADSAKDAVPVDETVRVPQVFINGTEIKGIDAGVDCKSVLALTKALN
jgi:glutaredoxin